MATKMTAIVMNTSYEREGELDDYISFIWTERYYTTGDFEIILPITDKNVSLCQMGNYIIRGDIEPSDYEGYTCIENAGIIEELTFDSNYEGVEQMHVSGRFLTGVLARRVCKYGHYIGSTPPNVAQVTMSLNLGVASSGSRTVPELNYPYAQEQQSSVSTLIDGEENGENVLDYISGLAENYGFGFRIRCLPELISWQMLTFDGVDRSYAQNVNPYVVFADTYDNLASAMYDEDMKGIVTDVLVNGEILDTGYRYNTWATNGHTNAGLKRYEAFVESAQVRVQEDGTILSDAQYLANLRTEGRLSIRNLAQAFSGEVYFGQYKWREDVDIGDIVTIKNERWGVYVNARIIEMIESTNEAGQYTSIPTFGI